MGLVSLGRHVHTASGRHGVACRSAPRWQWTTWCCASLMTHARPPAGQSTLQCALGVYSSCHNPWVMPAAHTTGILVSLVLCARTPGWQRGYACMERLGTLATTLSERNGTERNGTDRNGTDQQPWCDGRRGLQPAPQHMHQSICSLACCACQRILGRL